MKRLPPRDELRRKFDYNPETGQFTRLGNNPGRVANLNECNHSRYRSVRVNNERYLIHRLIWVWMTGTDPGELEVDHINNNRQDNSWNNLRLVTRQQKQLNRADTKQNGGVYQGSERQRERKAQHYRENRERLLAYEKKHRAKKRQGG